LMLLLLVVLVLSLLLVLVLLEVWWPGAFLTRVMVLGCCLLLCRTSVCAAAVLWLLVI
jgi:hypothetical protein